MLNKIKKLTKKEFVFLFLILLIAFVFRFYNLNWDENFHLHPDERFLTMVGNAMQLPSSVIEYLNPSVSKFNPQNINYGFFVYGIFPLTLNKLLALVFNNDNYNAFTIQGRVLSAFFDLLIVLFIFKSTEIFEKKLSLRKSVKYFAAFFYAISVLPIQLSHFFAVDTFLNFFMFCSFFLSLKFWQTKNILYILLSAILAGFAISSKLNGLAIIPLNLTFISFNYLNTDSLKSLLKSVTLKVAGKIFLLTFAYLSFVYIFARISNPYIFQNLSFFDLRLSENFIASINSLKSLTVPETTFPPSLQWVNRPPILFSLFNISFFGLGIVIFIFTIIGIIISLTKKKYLVFVIISLWAIALFIYQSTQFTQTMRYFIFLYPFFSILAGLGIYFLTKKLNEKIIIFLLFLSIVWPLMFFSIYTKSNTRVEASKWIYENINPNAKILAEHWDDPLPLPLDGKFYPTVELPIFHANTKEGWEQVSRIINEGDYIIFSSGRGYESIFNVKERFPELSKFYEDLFNGKTNYKKVAEFTSYPSLKYLGIPLTLSDDLSEEAFRVYDHPKVIIFKNIDL